MVSAAVLYKRYPCIIPLQTGQAALVIWLPFVFAIQMLARPSFGFDFILFDIVATRKSIFIHSFTLTISQALVKMLSKYQRQRVFCRLFSTHTNTHTPLKCVCVCVGADLVEKCCSCRCRCRLSLVI